MSILIGHDTALELLRSPGLLGSVSLEPCELDRIEGGSTSFEELRHTSAWKNILRYLSEPIDVMATGGRPSRSSGAIRVHGRLSSLPKGSFCPMGKDVLLSRPELLVMQLAPRLTRVQCIELVCEFCGGYALEGLGMPDVDGYAPGSSLLAKRDPVMSVASLASYLDQAAGACGVKDARAALRHAVDGSASPRETMVCLLFCLPERMGGYGIPKPVMNMRIDIPTDLQTLAGHRYYVADLCWPGCYLIIEYDSDAFHVGVDRIRSDNRRRTVLDMMGYDVITITSDQLRTAASVDRLARHIAAKLGFRVRDYVKDVGSRRAQLLAQLLCPVP